MDWSFHCSFNDARVPRNSCWYGQAFDDIEAAGDISPTVVAGGMKVALITTVFGLIVAIILQILYSYLLSVIEKIVDQMENSSISFMDIVYRYKNTQKQ
jgi:biopolymer transport protein ExbB